MKPEEMEMAYNRLSTIHGKLLNHSMDLQGCINQHEDRKNGWVGIGFAVGLMVGVLIGMSLK